MARERLEVPMVRDRPMCAYVVRLSPERHRGRKLPTKLGRVDDILNVYEDLIAEVARTHGGHAYKARCSDQKDKKEFLGVVRFEIAGVPLIDGEPVQPKRLKAKPASVPRAEAPEDLERIEAGRLRRRARAAKREQRRQEARARYRNELQALKEIIADRNKEKASEDEKRRKARQEQLKARRERDRRAAEQLRRAFGSRPKLGSSSDAATIPVPTSNHDTEPEQEELLPVADCIDEPDLDDEHGDEDDDRGAFEPDAERSAPWALPTAQPPVTTRPRATTHGTPMFDQVYESLHERALAARSRRQPMDWSKFGPALGKWADVAGRVLLRRGGGDGASSGEE